MALSGDKQASATRHSSTRVETPIKITSVRQEFIRRLEEVGASPDVIKLAKESRGGTNKNRDNWLI